MTTEEEISKFIASQAEPKRSEVEALHQLVLQASPGCKLQFSDGKNSDGKIVANPTIGYGAFDNTYANGDTKEMFQIGLSTNQTGISIYILGIEDKTYLARTYGDALGKAKVTGYCIRFKSTKDIDLAVLQSAIKFGFSAQNNP